MFARWQARLVRAPAMGGSFYPVPPKNLGEPLKALSPRAELWQRQRSRRRGGAACGLYLSSWGRRQGFCGRLGQTLRAGAADWPSLLLSLNRHRRALGRRLRHPRSVRSRWTSRRSMPSSGPTLSTRTMPRMSPSIHLRSSCPSYRRHLPLSVSAVGRGTRHPPSRRADHQEPDR
jgi:hypothetical protein